MKPCLVTSRLDVLLRPFSKGFCLTALGTLLLSSVPGNCSVTKPPVQAKGVAVKNGSDLSVMPNRQLEVVVTEQWKGRDYDHPVKPLELQRAILKRLRSERYTSDRVIEQTVRLVVFCEQSEQAQKKKLSSGSKDVTPIQLSDTLHFIDEILPLVEGRTALQSSLHEEKAYLYLNSGSDAGRLQEQKTVLALLTPFSLETDKRRLRAMMIVAEGAERKGDKKTADDLYYGVSLYPWWRVDDKDAFSDFTRLYANSIECLIRVREGDLPALKAITYAPAIRPQVERLYKEALERAEEKSQVPRTDNIK